MADAGPEVQARSVIQLINKLSFSFLSAKNECDKRGLECRFGSECKANSSDSYDCVCATGFKAVKVGEKVKSCEGEGGFTTTKKTNFLVDF